MVPEHVSIGEARVAPAAMLQLRFVVEVPAFLIGSQIWPIPPCPSGPFTDQQRRRRRLDRTGVKAVAGNKKAVHVVRHVTARMIAC